jgi:hypothetical protein
MVEKLAAIPNSLIFQGLIPEAEFILMLFVFVFVFPPLFPVPAFVVEVGAAIVSVFSGDAIVVCWDPGVIGTTVAVQGHH